MKFGFPTSTIGRWLWLISSVILNEAALSRVWPNGFTDWISWFTRPMYTLEAADEGKQTKFVRERFPHSKKKEE
ncbi:hypothetical protein [Paenibacillus luteus]|uniref:hypothetical protein n=1 Tax=Paenibacillus luteus TaxID=2545753 RepID=UPI00114383D0|nr:hypothetical protein [Paenibacillus luteus]